MVVVVVAGGLLVLLGRGLELEAVLASAGLLVPGCWGRGGAAGCCCGG